MDSFGQYGQDRFVDQYVFEERTGWFFVDIGAHDGVSLSNTAFFERYRGGDGACDLAVALAMSGSSGWPGANIGGSHAGCLAQNH